MLLGFVWVAVDWCLDVARVGRLLGWGILPHSEKYLLAPDHEVNLFTHLGYRRDAAGMQ